MIRRIQDEYSQKLIKKSLPCITPGGRFRYRRGSELIEHSGFMPFDVDFQDNKHITNFTDLKEQISHIKNVAYCGLSVRGNGFWGLVPIQKSTPDEHKLRFEALRQDFARFGIVLDPSGDEVNRLRIYSWDPEGYFKHSAETYTRIHIPELKPAPKYDRPQTGNNKWKVEGLIQNLNGIDITGHYKYEWFKIGCALASEFAESGRAYFHDISRFYPKYDPTETDDLYTKCLTWPTNRVTIASLFDIAKQYCIIYKTQEPVKMLSKSELKELALKEIGEFNHVPKDELIKSVGQNTFNQLISYKIISEAEPLKDNYFLTGGTPF